MNLVKQLVKCPSRPQILQNPTKRFLSCAEEQTRQNELFTKEYQRQREAVGRIEKIEVQYEGVKEKCILSMNKNLSTPHDCARHLGDQIRDRSVVALLNDETLWHLHRPLPDSCKLDLLHYNIPNPAQINKIFWRSCSFVLGAVISDAFKDKVQVQLHSFPSPNVKSGSFVYDAQLSLNDWKPTTSELKVLSLEMVKFCQKNHPIYTLNVDKDFALEMFRNNPHKTEQIPDIAAHNNEKVTLFKVGKHVDISRGPMVPNTRHFGRITVANIIKLETDLELQDGPLYRFQGVALPRVVMLNHFAYSLLEERARTLNSGRIPGSQDSINEDNTFVAQAVA